MREEGLGREGAGAGGPEGWAERDAGGGRGSAAAATMTTKQNRTKPHPTSNEK